MKNRIKYKNEKRYVKVDYMSEDNGKPLSLTDIFPIGHLKGSKVREAIDFSALEVSRLHNQGAIRLDGSAIKYLIAVEYNRKTKIRNG